MNHYNQLAQRYLDDDIHLRNNIFIELVFTNYQTDYNNQPLTLQALSILSSPLAWVRNQLGSVKYQINFVTCKLLPCYYFSISTLISNESATQLLFYYSLTKNNQPNSKEKTKSLQLLSTHLMMLPLQIHYILTQCFYGNRTKCNIFILITMIFNVDTVSNEYKE